MLNTYLERIKNTKTINTYIVYSKILKSIPHPISVEGLDNLIKQWRIEGKAVNTIVLNLTVIRSYLTFVNSRSPVEGFQELLDITRSVRGEEKISQIPNRNTIEDLISSTEFRKGTEKYKLILGFMLYLGLRINEVLGLDWEDILENEIVIRNTKGKRDRKVPIPPPLWEILSQFSPQEGKIFNQNPRSVQQFIGLHLKTHPHALRHLYASYLIQNSIPIEMVKTVLGHRDLKTTMRYVHLEQSDINKRVGGIWE